MHISKAQSAFQYVQRFGRAMFVLFGLAFLTAFLTSMHSRPASATAPGGSVTIANTPLPVTGNVNATVSGTVGISGIPSVAISNSPSVTIASAPANPVTTKDVGDYFSETYASSCSISATSGQKGGVCAFAAPPTGQGIVIETLSCQLQEVPGGRPDDISLTNGNTGGGLQLPYTVTTIPGEEDLLTVYVPLTKVLQPLNPSISVSAGLTGATFPFSTDCTVAGHLISGS